ncbi:MAG: GerMN domain-containing protein [Treponema sp.]|jgi:hypothetical protein|nr:GerMN domain-containing protein [Treponema sp.]
MSIKSGFIAIVRFFKVKSRYRLMLLALVSLFALGDFLFLGLVRRTFVFYSVADRSIIVEDRMLRRSGNRETDMTRYVEEVLLGPVSPDLSPLFPKETRLRALLYRDGVVYVDLSESAAFPPPEQGPALEEAGVFLNFGTLYEGIRRNFSYAQDVRMFVAGNAAFVGELGRPEDELAKSE